LFPFLVVGPPQSQHRRVLALKVGHRVCAITNNVQPAYPAFIQYRHRFYESDTPITIEELRRFEPRRVLE
jgi:hypothetical protein